MVSLIRHHVSPVRNRVWFGTGSAARLVSNGIDNAFINDMVPVTGHNKVQLYDGTYE